MRVSAERNVLVLGLGGLLLVAPVAWGQEHEARARETLTLATAARGQPPHVDADRVEGADARVSGELVYRPPRRGAPRDRTAGGLRAGRALPTLLALIPEHLALTVSEQPSLFWHIDAPVPEKARVVFTLTDEAHIEPLVERELPAPERAGIQRLRLADCGVALELEVEYAWAVALVTDPANRSRDVVATGYIQRVERPAALDSDAPASARVYAALGLWYDALEWLADALQASPGDPDMVEMRNALLRQAGLESVIEWPGGA